ncbi:hypothetical protein AVEN_158142-1 [Araneus ventricosus]|uniref:Uncharacterized protein n=1 Tax=Araneus ventricosus TaxID=182803 RepID=A0A4Y2Q0T4_ARAVE|nr:hypothetical protein AVEN_158142-1 [Araneus ventricosus]
MTHNAECDPLLEEVLETGDNGKGDDDPSRHDEQDVHDEEDREFEQGVRVLHVHVHEGARAHHRGPAQLQRKEKCLLCDHLN